jgi:general secretion pathway protein I
MKARGFTLLEVLIALAVLGISLAAALKASSQQADVTRLLQEKTFAHWVAMNVLTEIQVRQTFLPVGKTTGNVTLANQEWFWTSVVTDTMDKDIRRVDVSVSNTREAKQAVSVLVGFISVH